MTSGLPSVLGGTLFSPGDIVGYGAAGTVTGTKIAIAPLDFPGSVQTVPRDLIDDQSADSLNDLLRNVSSMTQNNGSLRQTGFPGQVDQKIVLDWHDPLGCGPVPFSSQQDSSHLHFPGDKA